jgi:hypothetical protein
LRITFTSDSTVLEGEPKDLATFHKLIKVHRILIPLRETDSRVYQVGLDKSVFEIDIGDLPPDKVPAYMERVRASLNKAYPDEPPEMVQQNSVAVESITIQGRNRALDLEEPIEEKTSNPSG